MLIRRIEIRNFKKLLGPLIFDGLKEGLNIIAGDNEEGKSTLLQAIKAGIFQKHNSKGQNINDFKPFRRAVRPEVTIELEYKQKQYSIRKGFCLKANAEFRSPEGIVEGSEAEEKIRELFGLHLTDKGKKSEQDHGIWGLLWLEQGLAGTGLNTTDGGKETLMRALESDLSHITGGQKGRILQKRIEKLYQNFYTPKSKTEKGELTKAVDHLELKQAELDQHKATYAEYDKKLLKLQDVLDQLQQLEKNKTLETTQKEYENLGLQRSQAEKLKLELNAAIAENSSASMELERLEKEIDNRNKLIQRRSDTATKIATLSDELAIQKTQDKELSAKTDELDIAIKALQEEKQKLDLLCKTAERVNECTSLEQQKEELATRIAYLTDLAKQYNDANKLGKEIAVDATALEKLKTLSNTLVKAEAHAAAIATKVKLMPQAGAEASIADKKFGKEDLILTEETSIRLENWGEITVIPGGKETAEINKLLLNARQSLEAELKSLGVSSFSEAEQQSNKKRELELKKSSIMSTLQQYGGRNAIELQKEKLKEIENKIETLKQELNNAPILESGSSLLDLKVEFDNVNKTLQSSLKSFDKLREDCVNSTKLCTKKEAELNSAQDMLRELEQRLTEFNQETEIIMQQRLKDSKMKALELHTKVQQKRDDFSKLDEENLKEKEEQLKRSLKTLELNIQNLRETKIKLSAEIDAHGHSGLGEQVQRLEGEVEVANQRLSQLRLRAQALKLLHETLLEAESESRSKILQPVINMMRPHMQQIFPSSELSLDEGNFEIAHLVRDGVEEDFRSLSLGTREQLSILTRIAMAKLMKEQGQAALLLLDDVLVYSDDKRFSLMKQIIQESAKDLQIIILTCRLRDYEDMVEANVIRFPRAQVASL